MDTFLLKQFQKVTDFLQLTFGITCFTVSRILLITYQIFDFITISLKTDKREITIDTMGLIIEIFIAIPFFFLFWYLVSFFEKETRNSPQFKNSLEERFELPRKLSIFFLLMSIYYSLNHDQVISSTQEMWLIYLNKMRVWRDVFYFFFIYFISCTPKPPQKSKIQSLLEYLFLKPAVS